MSGTHIQYIVPTQGASFETRSVPTPTPEANEVNVRIRAIGLNPVDWKSRHHGTLVQSWPAVLGLEFAGVVHSVGSSITDLKPGDEVFGYRGQSGKGAAFQEIITVPLTSVAKKPASLSFEEAASLPIGYFTAAAGLVAGLNIPLSWVKTPTPQSPRSILVIGASSAVGTAALQLLRENFPSAQVLTTSSAAHHAHLKSLGASETFERSAQADPSAIRKAAIGGNGVDAILDTVAAAGTQPEIFRALDNQGLKTYAHIATGTKVVAKEVGGPKDLEVKMIGGYDIYRFEGGKERLLGSVREAVEKGVYQLPVRVEVVGKGLGVIQEALERFEKGVSGTKLVVSL